MSVNTKPHSALHTRNGYFPKHSKPVFKMWKATKARARIWMHCICIYANCSKAEVASAYLRNCIVNKKASVRMVYVLSCHWCWRFDVHWLFNSRCSYNTITLPSYTHAHFNFINKNFSSSGSFLCANCLCSLHANLISRPECNILLQQQKEWQSQKQMNKWNANVIESQLAHHQTSKRLLTVQKKKWAKNSDKAKDDDKEEQGALYLMLAHTAHTAQCRAIKVQRAIVVERVRAAVEFGIGILRWRTKHQQNTLTY